MLNVQDMVFNFIFRFFFIKNSQVETQIKCKNLVSVW